MEGGFIVVPHPLEIEYRKIEPLARAFAGELDRQIGRLLEANNVQLGFPIQHRLKTWGSIDEKLARRSLQIETLAELQDLVGLRLIVLFKRDIEKVCSLLAGQFQIVKQYDTQERLSENQFGYASVHLILKVPPTWLKVPTLSDYGDLIAEIQVRTLAQHIWSAASHVLQYKKENTVPTTVRRSIYRVSALLETVDLEFERLLSERDAYRSAISEAAPSETLDEKLNVDSLDKLLQELFPAKNWEGSEGYAELLSELFHFGVETPRKLTEIIRRNKKNIEEREASEVARSKEELAKGGIPVGTSEARATAGVYFTHVGLARVGLSCAFGKRYNEWKLEEMQKKRLRSRHT